MRAGFKKDRKIAPYFLCSCMGWGMFYLIFLTPGPNSWCVCSKHLERVLSSDNQSDGKQFKVGDEICKVSGKGHTTEQCISKYLLARVQEKSPPWTTCLEDFYFYFILLCGQMHQRSNFLYFSILRRRRKYMSAIQVCIWFALMSVIF